MAQTIRFLTPRTLLLVGVGSSCALAAWSLRAPAARSALFSITADAEGETPSNDENTARSGSASGLAAGKTHAASPRTQKNTGVESAQNGARRAEPVGSTDDDTHDVSEPSEEPAFAQPAEANEGGANGEGSFWSRVKRSVFGATANGINIGNGLGSATTGGATAVPSTNTPAPSTSGKTSEVPWNPAATNNNGQPSGKNGLALSGAGSLESPCDKCRETNCRHYLDTDLVEACFEQINTEQGADPNDRLFLRSCQDVMACAHSTGCAYGVHGPAPCYCGSADVDHCASEGPAADALCRSRWQVAARTEDHALIMLRMSDTAYPSGWAHALLECEREFCRDACMPH